MARALNLHARLTGPLSESVSAKLGDEGAYENLSDYVRDLVRRDRDRADREAFDRPKAELSRAFAAADSDYEQLDADRVIARNRRR